MKIHRKLIFPIYVAIVVAIAFLVALIAHWLGAYNPNGWGFFTLFSIFGAAISYVVFRQVYWWITGTGAYIYGGLPKLRKNKK